ncbi:DUF4279 domain-containing protein [Peribacillus sp. NPDC097675]|uniref:DUF4279 domain-containing protein n=1 Tax=Peribacillus sp. NPDC097675 TaxID=3390618 RepID=UPI003D00633A
MDKTRVKAYFSAYGEDFPLEIVTEVLGIKPTKTFNKGDIINHSNLASTTSKRRKQTDWILSTGYQESYDINDQLNPILKSLEGKTEELNQLKKNYHVEFSSIIQAEIQFDLYIVS